MPSGHVEDRARLGESQPRARLLDGGEDSEGQCVVLGEGLGEVAPFADPVLRHVDHHAPGERTNDVQNDVRADLQSTTGPIVIRETVTGNVDQQVRAEPQRVEFDAV